MTPVKKVMGPVGLVQGLCVLRHDSGVSRMHLVHISLWGGIRAEEGWQISCFTSVLCFTPLYLQTIPLDLSLSLSLSLSVLCVCVCVFVCLYLSHCS